MKFRCERDVLAEALATAGRAVSSRGGSLPVLAGLRLDLHGDALTVTGSDLDLTITAAIEVAGADDGVVVIPSKLVADVVRAIEPGAVEVDVSDGDVQISGGRSEFSLRTIAAEEFPQVSVAAGDAVTLAAGNLAEALRQVVPAASADDSRPILTGVLLAAEANGLRLVATDSYRLAVRDLPGTSVLEEGQQVLVPSRALSELSRMLGSVDEITLHLGDNEASVVVGSTTLTTRLIEGDFPNYRGLIPENQPNTLTVSRPELLDAIRRVRLLAQESTPLRMAMSSDGLELIAMTQDVGQAHEVVDASYDGGELTVAFNPEYLLNGVEVSSGDEIRLESVDALKPAVLRSVGDDDFLYLLMPVRVS